MEESDSDIRIRDGSWQIWGLNWTLKDVYNFDREFFRAQREKGGREGGRKREIES